MVKNEGCGWASFRLGGFNGRASYLTEVPIDLVNAAINLCKTGLPQATGFDEEGSEFVLVLTPDTSYIISSRDTYRLYPIEKPWYEICEEILHDIEEETADKWAESFCVSEEDEKNFADRLETGLKELRHLLRTSPLYAQTVESMLQSLPPTQEKPQRRTSFQRKKTDKERLKKLASETDMKYRGGAYFNQDKQRYVRWSFSDNHSKHPKYVRRHCNKRIRKLPNVPSRNGYRKMSEYWYEIC